MKAAYNCGTSNDITVQLDYCCLQGDIILTFFNRRNGETSIVYEQ